jgi:uncharacterized SAM-binding protein YcdF (DUF218 family)
VNRHRWLWLTAGVAALLLVVVQSRTIWLPAIASNLIVEDALRPADVIAVFAGAHGDRARHAARLYQDGIAPRILATGALTATEIQLFCGRRVTGAELTAKVLTDAGVPHSAVIVIPQGTSTYEEGETIKASMKTHGYRSVIAVSSPYHMRRVKATLEHLLHGTEMKVQYSPTKDADIQVERWWTNEKDLINVTNEYLKLAYYHLALF